MKGNQVIGCGVTSCKYNEEGCECSLERIEVRPCCDCHTGRENESLCGSYRAD